MLCSLVPGGWLCGRGGRREAGPRHGGISAVAVGEDPLEPHLRVPLQGFCSLCGLRCKPGHSNCQLGAEKWVTANDACLVLPANDTDLAGRLWFWVGVIGDTDKTCQEESEQYRHRYL